MDKQLFWEEVEIGAKIPALPKIATTQMLVKWAGASGDFAPLHYDEHFAQASGLSMPIVHGALKRQWLVQLVTDWIGDEGFLKKFSCQYRQIDYPRSMKSFFKPKDGETWMCKGEVTNKYKEGKNYYVDCKIWVENARGEVTTPGKVTVVLPSKTLK